MKPHQLLSASKSRSQSPSFRWCPIHSKGLLTLCLLLISDGVTFSNAVTDMHQQQQHHQQQNPHDNKAFFGPSSANTNQQQQQQQQQATTGGEDCPASVAASAGGGGINNLASNVLSIFPKSHGKGTGGPSRLLKSHLHQQRHGGVISNSANFDESYCCSDACLHCLPHDTDTERLCRRSLSASLAVGSIPRGGHSISAAKAAAEGLADTAAGGAATTTALAVVLKTPYGIPLHLWKVLFQAVLTAINVLCWLIPLRSKKISENKTALSLANAFSGGVFLSLAFGHLIPECVHGMSIHTDNAVSSLNLPEAFPYLMVLAGYLLIFFVEKVAFDAHEILHEMEHAGEATATKHSSPTTDNDATVTVNGSGPTTTAVASAAPVGKAPPGGRAALILLGALAVHSVLEMMALGLSDSFGDCALLTLSIALHQPAESIALLVAFLKSGMPKSQILQYLSVFSCMGPVGVALGMAVNEYAAPIVDSIMVAVVAGTFVYVGATEVIPEEFEDSENKWKKFAALLSGMVSILVITQYTMSLGIE